MIFEQCHKPGERAQSDFTHMEDLHVTLADQPFPHMVFHLVLTYSNVEAVTICFSESFEALAEGMEACLWQIGGVRGSRDFASRSAYEQFLQDLIYKRNQTRAARFLVKALGIPSSAPPHVPVELALSPVLRRHRR